MSVNSRLKEQVASIVSTDKKEITLNFIDVQVQRGTCDCGLFALAFATCLAYGCLSEKHCFDQGRMRNHLHDCLKNGELTMFPVVKERTSKKRIKNILHLCPSLGRVLVNTYRLGVNMYIGGESIMSVEGTTQGDPMAMAMYALGTQLE